ncbi:MAG TPA: 4'-phosphopantetheinyl transferase superfamily protein [Kofleriaceae bacterium]|nr:4'-phosphopantetheinyl transferase superfamily protein [Kofleriaceae bacterium]
MNTALIEETIAAALGAPVRVAIEHASDAGAYDPVDDHLLGRRALARALTAAGRRADEVTTWPCAFASVSHSRGTAVAVALPRGERARGIGVDLERDRPVRPGLAGVFCDARERAWLDTVPAAERDATVLRLWTAKEALYKADAAQGDAIVAEYGVDVPALERGGRGAARTTRLTTLRIGDASLSVALAPEEHHVESTR